MVNILDKTGTCTCVEEGSDGTHNHFGSLTTFKENVDSLFEALTGRELPDSDKAEWLISACENHKVNYGKSKYFIEMV